MTVTLTYNGKAHSCRCGCKGRYSKEGKPSARVVNVVRHQDSVFPAVRSVALGGESFVDVTVGDRDYTFYYRD